MNVLNIAGNVFRNGSEYTITKTIRWCQTNLLVLLCVCVVLCMYVCVALLSCHYIPLLSLPLPPPPPTHTLSLYNLISLTVHMYSMNNCNLTSTQDAHGRLRYLILHAIKRLKNLLNWTHFLEATLVISISLIFFPTVFERKRLASSSILCWASNTESNLTKKISFSVFLSNFLSAIVRDSSAWMQGRNDKHCTYWLMLIKLYPKWLKDVTRLNDALIVTKSVNMKRRKRDEDRIGIISRRISKTACNLFPQ